MPTNVLMPQLGESIAEGTIVRWIKKVGELVDRDEPLFEISTDKVDAEIPSPAAGVVARILAETGETVPVNSIVAVISGEGEAVEQADVVTVDREEDVSTVGLRQSIAETIPKTQTRRRLSPLVRKLADKHGVDPTLIVGTGDGGRVTKADVLAFAEEGGIDTADRLGTMAITTPRGRIEPMSPMRRSIAERMVASRLTSAHAHTVFEVDFSGVAAIRANRSASEKTPTYLSYVARAVADALVAMPVINASLDGKNIVYHEEVNLGIAVALDWGLIVPVIRRADRLSVDEIDDAVVSLTKRAKSKRLSPNDVSDGTFTITNPGGSGSVFGIPIINQPQSAIMCVGTIEKRPAVIEDAIVARLQAFLTLGFDHRLIDGAVADRFLDRVRNTLENFPQDPPGGKKETG